LPQRRARFMRARIALLALLLLGGAGAVVRRAFSLQVRQAPVLKEMAEEQYLKEINLAPKRGTIFDRNGAELAVSVDVDSVYANPRRMRAAGVSPAQAADKLVPLLGVERELILERLSSDKHFAWIKRRISPKESMVLRAMALPGIGLTSEARRYYPNRELAAHVLGYANVDGLGIDGLELTLDQRLRGSASQVPAIRDRTGKVVFSEQLLDDRAAQGDDVVLTLDKTIQYIAERELELAVRTFEAKGGSVVVLDPRSGEVLAIANFPTFNPNDPASASLARRRNRAITDRFEPGSTLKPFTLAGAFAAGAIHADDQIDCEQGALKVAQYTIHDTHKWDSLTPAEVLIYSSNIGAAKIGLAMGRARLYRTLRDFGFGAATDVGLPGETSGILRPYKRWYDMDAATIPFGQGISVTTLQLAAAMGALANHGSFMHPVLVKRVEDARGDVVQEALPHAGKEVVPAQVAAQIADMLTGVTGEGGTGTEAAIDGLLVAGKTGTAQKADYVHGGYADDKWLSSFIGFAPARKPRLVVAVAIDEPMIAHHGGTVAAPTFRRIMEASLRQLGVVPNAPVAPVSRQRKSVLSNEQAGAARSAVPHAEQALAAAVPPDAPALKPDERRVPDLLGKSARAALLAASQAGLLLAFEGSGVVVAQKPSAFEAVQVGATVQATLAAPPREGAPNVAEGAKPEAPNGGTGAEVQLARAGGRDG
jgi:cell division protein FtsI (penicillin-binding protein 3)